MKQIYIIKDKTDANFRKPFVGIYKDENQAKQKVANMQNKMSPHVQKLVFMEAVEVADFDANKTSVYVVYDKTDTNHNKAFMSMHFDFMNAEKQLKTLRAKVAPHAQKLIYAQMEKLA